MATLGGFADLSRYQQAAAQPLASPLDSLIQGFSQGQAIRNLPQTLQQNALNAQIEQALTLQKLQALQQPEIIKAGENLFVRDATSPNGIRSIFTPTSVASPKLGRIIVDEPSGRIFEVTATGMRERSLTEGLGSSNIPLGGSVVSTTPVLTPETSRVQTLKTMNFVQPDGTTHTFSVDNAGNRVQDLGIAKSAPTLTPKKSGSTKAPPAKIQDQYLASQNLFQTAPRFEQKVEELRRTGVKEPTAFEKTIINQAYQNPEGIISGLATALATGQIRPEIAELEQLRAEIEGNYVTAKAGLSQTAGEVKRTIPVAPTRFDSWDKMLSKVKNLREVSEINVSNINKQYPGYFNASQPAVASTTLEFDTEAEVPNDLPVGTIITIGGKRATIE